MCLFFLKKNLGYASSEIYDTQKPAVPDVFAVTEKNSISPQSIKMLVVSSTCFFHAEIILS